MTYEVSIGEAPKITRKVENRDEDPLNSFWLGCRFNLDRMNGNLAVAGAYLALYTSHATDKHIPASGPNGPQMADFGPLKKDGAWTELRLEGTGGEALVFQGLDYVACEDVEASNEAMQLHLFRFNPAADIATWFDDSSWIGSFDAVAEFHAEGQPWWKRTCSWGQNPGKYTHVAWRHRNAQGLRSLGVGMPFLARSLCYHIVQAHNKPFFDLSVQAMGRTTNDDEDQMHWQESVDPQTFVKSPANVKPWGVAHVCEGAFLEVMPSDFGRVAAEAPKWQRLLTQGNEFELCRELMDAVAQGSPDRHSLRAFADTAHNSVVPAADSLAQEFLYLSMR